MNVRDLPDIMAQDEQGAVIPIYQKDGDPYLALDGTPSTFTVVGTESKQYMTAKRAHQKRLFKLMNRLRGQDLDPEVSRLEDIKLLSAAVTGWHGWDDGEKDSEPTPENVREVLAVPHIFDQVQAGVGAHADFSKANSGS